MQFNDLNAQQSRIRAQVDENIKNVLDHGQYILGPEVKELEMRLADYVGVSECIGVASGTDALLISMMVLGIGPGDEVITPTFNFIATAEAVALLGATPVYVDIDKTTYNMNPALIEEKITPRTRAIIPVSMYGQCADYDEINKLAERNNIVVIEDAAQSFGARYKSRQSCSLTKIGVTSFFPSKPLGAYGDAGAIFTDDVELALKMRQISRHGQDGRYNHVRVGVNSRLDTIQAAVLLAKLTIFDEEVGLREEKGELFTTLLKENGITGYPRVESYNNSVYGQYTVRLEDRETIIEKLANQAIPTAIHYPAPVHLQPALLNETVFAPESVLAANQVVSLPFHPYITKSEIKRVVEVIAETMSAN